MKQEQRLRSEKMALGETFFLNHLKALKKAGWRNKKEFSRYTNI
jgi:hypothetical protein